ncbi:MAG TPA: beta/gamma crystallin-related protein [Roseiflexaceae bacterium]|nr:beta/gamma crystallin-related protein [Roseiflexaceae bacterium]
MRIGKGIFSFLGALLLAAAALGAGAIMAAPTQQAAACDGGEGVYLYEHSDYRGRCLRLTGDAADLSAFGFNNIASSVRVVGNLTAVLYVDQNYGNVASTFGFDSPDLRGTVVDNDRASAVRLIRGYRQSTDEICRGDGVYLYEGVRFTGRCVRYTGDEPDLGDQRFNDQASSVRIVGNYSARLFVDDNYRGFEAILSQSLEDLNATAVGRRRASSIRVGRVGGPNACTGGDGVYLYEHPNYQGRCVRLTADAPDLRLVGFDDTASSVRIIGRLSATLYRDLSATGVSSTFTGDDPNLADNPIGDNQATSLRVAGTTQGDQSACTGEGVYLYEHPNYQGRCLRFTADNGDLRTVGFDDTASSIRIIGSWTATLFRDLSGTGIATTFTGDDPNLADNPIGDNHATSLRVFRGQGQQPSPPTQPPPVGGPVVGACDGNEGVYLYEHPNYQGRCVRFTADNNDLRTVGFDDTASSIRIIGSWTAALFRDLSGTGGGSTFTGDDPNLFDDLIGDNQATSLRVARGQQAPPPAAGPVGACDGNEGVYLYEGTNYTGACIRLTGDVADLRSYHLDDAVSSVRVFGRWSVMLFRDLSYTGASSTFIESDPDLRNDGVGSNQATSVIVRRR